MRSGFSLPSDKAGYESLVPPQSQSQSQSATSPSPSPYGEHKYGRQQKSSALFPSPGKDANSINNNSDMFADGGDDNGNLIEDIVMLVKQLMCAVSSEAFQAIWAAARAYHENSWSGGKGHAVCANENESTTCLSLVSPRKRRRPACVVLLPTALSVRALQVLSLLPASNNSQPQDSSDIDGGCVASCSSVERRG